MKKLVEDVGAGFYFPVQNENMINCIGICNCYSPGCYDCPIQACFTKLAEYEKTGLKPREIMKLKNK